MVKDSLNTAKNSLDKINLWFQKNPGVFLKEKQSGQISLKELYSQKNLNLKLSKIEAIEEKTNSLQPNQTYLVLLLENHRQLVLCQQGFAFAPDFSATGELPLPSQVYCMRDFHELFLKLKHLATEEGRQKEALELILILIAILDGAKAVGLNVDLEIKEVEESLAKLEKGQALPKLPGH